MRDYADVKKGMFTGKNSRFLRYWFEVKTEYTSFNIDSNEYINHDLKWYPYNKGGLYRKWYGNHEYLVNWEDDGKEIRNFDRSGVVNTSYFFKEEIGWTRTSNEYASFRYYPKGFLFDSAGCSIFNDENREYLMGFLNSSIAKKFLDILSPTINYEVGQISNLPIIENYDHKKEIIFSVRENIELCKND